MPNRKYMTLKLESFITLDNQDTEHMTGVKCTIIDIHDNLQNDFKVRDVVIITPVLWIRCSQSGLRNPFEVPFPEGRIWKDIPKPAEV
jgi:hypothetical protein